MAFLAAPAVFFAEVPVALADDFAVEAVFLACVVVVLARVVVFLASAFRSWVACWRRMRATRSLPRTASSTYCLLMSSTVPPSSATSSLIFASTRAGRVLATFCSSSTRATTRVRPWPTSAFGSTSTFDSRVCTSLRRVCTSVRPVRAFATAMSTPPTAA